jgi:anti-sigma-K factor RskA
MSDDFDSLLDRCLADTTAGRETIDACLRRYPTQAARLAVLLKTAERAQAASLAISLPADKRLALESRLLRRAGQLRSRPAPRAAAPRVPFWRRGFALAVASLVVIVALLGSAVSASASSLPGDILYPVKRAAEQVRLALTVEQQQADLHLQFARQRLQELQQLTDRGEVSPELLDEISSETAAVLEGVPALPQDKRQAVLASLTDFQDQHARVLAVMASAAQGDAQARVMAALADSEAKRKQAAELLERATPPTVVPPDNPPKDVAHPTASKKETRPAHEKPTMKPAPTERPPQAPAKATKAPPAPPDPPHQPTPKVERTPPGQGKQAESHSPPERPTKVPKDK